MEALPAVRERRAVARACQPCVHPFVLYAAAMTGLELVTECAAAVDDEAALLVWARADQLAAANRGLALGPAQAVERHKAMLHYWLTAPASRYVTAVQRLVALVACQPDMRVLSVRNYWAEDDRRDAVSIFARLSFTAAGGGSRRCDLRLSVVTPELLRVQALRDRRLRERVRATPTIALQANQHYASEEVAALDCAVAVPLGAMSLGVPTKRNNAMSHE